MNRSAPASVARMVYQLPDLYTIGQRARERRLRRGWLRPAVRALLGVGADDFTQALQPPADPV